MSGETAKITEGGFVSDGNKLFIVSRVTDRSFWAAESVYNLDTLDKRRGTGPRQLHPVTNERVRELLRSKKFDALNKDLELILNWVRLFDGFITDECLDSIVDAVDKIKQYEPQESIKRRAGK
jgi:hypothetical protein